METKFNLYDLFGIFIPGAILCIVIYYFLVGIKAIEKLDVSWAETIILIPLAYAVGTVIHHSARYVVKIHGYSLKLLKEEHTEFTPEFKRLLEERIEETFKLKAPTKPEAQDKLQQYEKDLEAFRQMAFKLCYDYVIQSAKGVYTENFNAVYGMCRSMMIVIFGSVVLALIYLFMQDPYPDWRALATFLGIAMIGGMILIKLFHEGMNLNAQRFAISVYRSFYLACLQAKQTDKPDTEIGKD